MKLFKLRGGVHPEGRKTSSADAAIRALPLPPYLYVPLQQHIGAPAKPVVQVGELVLAGQLIGAGQGNVSAPVHAPTSGQVVAIGDHPAPHPSGLPVATVTIAPDGAARWIEAEVPADPFALAPDDIAARVGAAGIVGLGGAAFPSAVKLDASRKSGVDTLIINGSECEPYLTCDDRIMRERAADIVAGIRLIQRAVGARRALVGIEDNKPEALAAMRAAAAGTGVEIRAVPAMYPMGWEKQMIQALLGREVPAEGRSARRSACWCTTSPPPGRCSRPSASVVRWCRASSPSAAVRSRNPATWKSPSARRCRRCSMRAAASIRRRRGWCWAAR